jgi:PAS domain S-box-containing protein
MRVHYHDKKKVLFQIPLPVIISIILLLSSYYFTISYVKELLVNDKKIQSKEMVRSVYNLIEQYYDDTNKGVYTKEQAQEKLCFDIKHLRYGKDSKDYFWLLDAHNNIISHPYFIDSTSLVKTNPHYHQILKNLVSIAVNNGDGYSEYYWQWKDDPTRVEKKISYAKYFKPWKWIIGTGFYVEEVNQEIKALTRYIMVVLLLIILVVIVLYVIIIRRAFKNLQEIRSRETELVKSEKRFRGMANNIDSGLIILENNKIVFINKKIRKIFNLTKEELSSININDFIVAEEKERFKALTKEILNLKDITKEYGFWVTTKDNKKKFLVSQVSYESSHHIGYTYILIWDNTKRKEIERKIKILSSTIEQSPDSIIITDLEGKITFVNAKFEEITGYHFDEVKGKNPKIWKSDKMSPSIYMDLWKTITSGNVWKGEILNKKKNSELFWEKTIIFPIKNEFNQIVNYASIKTDLSKIKFLEGELVKLKDQAQVSMKFKDSFLNNISHEVRTPLNAILGFSGILKSTFKFTDQEYEFSNIIIDSANTLLDFFEGVIQYSTVNSGLISFEKAEIELNKFILKLVSKYNSLLATDDSKSVDIIVEKDKNTQNAILIADIKWFAMIFDNLLANAVKYTEKGTIQIGYSIDHQSIIFHIRDTGVGIPLEAFDSIFESFAHGDNRYFSLHKGPGLGLNISKKLLELMGGDLWFISEENIGSTFYFSLPSIDVKNYSLGDLEVHSLPYAGLFKGKKIIIADQNEETSSYLKNILNNEPVDISLAQDGNELLFILENNINEDIIIFMDSALHLKDGYNTARTIKNNFSKFPFIGLINQHSEKPNIENDFFDALLFKPFPKNQVYEVVHRFLNN